MIIKIPQTTKMIDIFFLPTSHLSDSSDSLCSLNTLFVANFDLRKYIDFNLKVNINFDLIKINFNLKFNIN